MHIMHGHSSYPTLEKHLHLNVGHYWKKRYETAIIQDLANLLLLKASSSNELCCMTFICSGIQPLLQKGQKIK